MEPWSNGVTNLGIGVALCGAMVWFLRYLVTVTLPALVKTFAEQLEKEREASERRHAEEREASERRHADLLARMDRAEAAQIQRHQENRTDAQQLRHLVKNLDTSVATFMAAVGEHLGVIHRPSVLGPEKKS